jgi:flagellar motor switch protein FliM
MAGLLSQDEIDVLMGAIAGGDVPAETQANKPGQTRPAKPARPYDFTHAAIFSREQLLALQALHDRLAALICEELSATVRGIVQAKCIGVDQLPYNEFVFSQAPTCPAMSLCLANGEHRVLFTINPVIVAGVLDRFTGGGGAGGGPPEAINRELTELEMTLLDGFFNHFLNMLNAVWAKPGLAFALERVDTSPQAAQIVLASETVAVATVEVAFAQAQGMLCICYPASVVGMLKENKSAKPAAEDQKAKLSPSARLKTEQVVSKIPLKLVALLGTARLTLSEVLQIKPGDVIPLQRAVHEHVEIEVGGRARFKGFLGAHRGKKAVLIDARIDGQSKE